VGALGSKELGAPVLGEDFLEAALLRVRALGVALGLGSGRERLLSGRKEV